MPAQQRRSPITHGPRRRGMEAGMTHHTPHPALAPQCCRAHRPRAPGQPRGPSPPRSPAATNPAAWQICSKMCGARGVSRLHNLDYKREVKFLDCPNLLCCLPAEQARQLSPVLPARRICSFHPRLAGAEESATAAAGRASPQGGAGCAEHGDHLRDGRNLCSEPCPQASELNA